MSEYPREPRFPEGYLPHPDELPKMPPEYRIWNKLPKELRPAPVRHWWTPWRERVGDEERAGR